MAATDQLIQGKISGDDLRITRIYSDFPTGITLSQAWLTIKENEWDVDAAAVVGPKSITTNLTVHGQITDATSTSDLAVGMYFDIADTETALLEPYKAYAYDIQVKTSAGAIYTCELGNIVMDQGVTVATS